MLRGGPEGVQKRGWLHGLLPLRDSQLLDNTLVVMNEKESRMGGRNGDVQTRAGRVRPERRKRLRVTLAPLTDTLLHYPGRSGKGPPLWLWRWRSLSSAIRCAMIPRPLERECTLSSKDGSRPTSRRTCCSPRS